MSLVELAFANTIVAATLALVARVAQGRVPPAVAHVLWLLVLVKLVTPPLVRVEPLRLGELLPALSAPTAIPGEAPGDRFSSMTRAPIAAPARTAPGTVQSAGRWLRSGAAGVAMAGTGVLLLISSVRVVRFRRALRRAGRPPAEVDALARRVADTLGLDRVPGLRWSDEALSPALWGEPGRCEIVLPARLFEALSVDERELLLAHELAHVRRRDHWVRPLELGVIVLYWWLPLAWWARRRMRLAEEAACDDLVLRLFPRRARAYADTLLTAVEFLGPRTREPVPALATGAAPAHSMKERLTMILSPRPRRRSRTVPMAFLAFAGATLLFTPGWVRSKQVDEGTKAPSEREQTMIEREQALAERELDHRVEALVLEKRLRQLDLEREKIEMELHQKRIRHELERLEAEVASAAAEGDAVRAAELREEIDSSRRRVELERKTLEEERARRSAELEIEVRRETLEIEFRQHELRGELDAAMRVRKELLTLNEKLRELELQTMRGELARRMAEIEWKREELARELRKN